jgi:hypothetical protein
VRAESKESGVAAQAAVAFFGSGPKKFSSTTRQ